MYICRCGRYGLQIEDTYQCWQSSIKEKVWEENRLKSGEIVCGRCYAKFNPDGLMKKHEHFDKRSRVIPFFTCGIRLIRED